MKPLISVIVPVYKVEEYLPRCVDSLRAQTYENLEIILVDDGSPDGCPALCEAYAGEDRRIRVIHQKNRGLSGARNAGIALAEGEYLAFVDSDDYVAEDYVQALYQLAQDTGCPIAQCRFAYVQGEPPGRKDSRVWKIYRGDCLMSGLYGPEDEATHFVVAWNKLYRRDLFDDVRYPEGRVHEDEATTYLLFHKAKKLAFLDQTLYGYFTGNTGSITSVFSRKRLDWLTAHEERIRFFQEHGYGRLLPQAYRKLCDACITFYFRCTDQVEDAGQLRRELRDRLAGYLTQGADAVAKLPLQTRIGYRIFRISPGIYQILLKRMQESA